VKRAEKSRETRCLARHGYDPSLLVKACEGAGKGDAGENTAEIRTNADHVRHDAQGTIELEELASNPASGPLEPSRSTLTTERA